jgi:hypothetical protein
MPDEKINFMKMNIKVAFNIVSLEIVCRDSYEAQVLFDDLVERIKSDGGMVLGFSGFGKQKATTEN